MDLAEAQRAIARLTYKPGWELQSYPEPHTGGLILRFGKDEPDSEVEQGIRPLMFTSRITAKQLGAMDEHDLLQFAFDVLVHRELHEVEEWLRFDGQPVYEPHPDKWHRGILGDGNSLKQPEPRVRRGTP